MVRAAIIINDISCMNRCVFCKPERKEVPYAKDKLEQTGRSILRQALELRQNGILETEISGGDPIEYPRIGRFIRLLKKMGFRKIMLSTHGRLFHDREFAEDIALSGVDILRIPIYGSNAETHDSITLEKGSFKETLKGIKRMASRKGISLYITSLIMRQNIGEIEGIYRLASGYADRISISVPCISHNSEHGILADYREMKEPVLKIAGMAEKDRIDFSFADIPFCVIGMRHHLLNNQTGPPETAGSYSIPEQFVSEIKGVPNYRVKERIPACMECGCYEVCQGFYRNHIWLLDLGWARPVESGRNFQKA